MKSISTWVKKHQLVIFLILAYSLSWIVEIPLALQAQGIIQKFFPFSFHYLSGYGPLLSALIVTRITGGSESLRELWGRMTRWKVKPEWWLVAVSPLGIYLLAAAVLWLIQSQRMDIMAMGLIDYLPPLRLAAIPLWILTFGIGEETGWRGFALPRLQKKTRGPFRYIFTLGVLGILAPALVLLFLRPKHYSGYVDRSSGRCNHLHLALQQHQRLHSDGRHLAWFVQLHHCLLHLQNRFDGRHHQCIGDGVGCCNRSFIQTRQFISFEKTNQVTRFSEE